MISLTNNSNSTIQKLQAFLSGAASTTNPTCTVHSYIVPSTAKVVRGSQGQIAGDPSEYRRAPEFKILAGTAETDISAAPPSGAVKDIVQISIYNADTAAVTVTVCIDQNGTNEILIVCTLLTKETLHYEDGQGWYATDSGGARKTALGPNGAFTNLTVSGNTTLGDSAADSLTINAGVFSWPNLPCFLAFNSTTRANATGAGTTVTVTFDTEVFDQGNNFSSNTFTALVTGKYRLSFQVRVSSLSVAMTGKDFTLITSNRTYSITLDDVPAGAGEAFSGVFSQVCDVDAGDTAIVRVRVSGGASDAAGIFGDASILYTCFGGEQVA